MYNEKFLNNLNALNRDDELIKNIASGIGTVLDDLLSDMLQLENNFWFDKMDEEIGIPLMIKLLNLMLRKDLTLDEKRNLIESRWKNTGKISEESLQKIADNWRNGAIDVEFNNKIVINFVGVEGIPSAIDELKEEFNKAKPAFLEMSFTFLFRRHSELHAYTHHQLHAYTHKELKEKEVI